MSLEENKKVALAFLHALKNKDAGQIDGLLDDSGSFWIIGDLPFSGSHRKPRYMELVRSMFDVVRGDLTIEVMDVTAEDDRVSVTGKGDMTTVSGEKYDNDYHFFFCVKNGKIVRSREYVDTHMIYNLADIRRDEVT